MQRVEWDKFLDYVFMLTFILFSSNFYILIVQLLNSMQFCDMAHDGKKLVIRLIGIISKYLILMRGAKSGIN